MRKLVVLVVSLVLFLIVVDRVGVVVAENVVADTMQNSQHLAATPDVDIAGFPFLTQLVSEELDQVTITAKNVPIGNSTVQVTVASIRAVMKNVKINISLHSVTIGHGDATALISYAELSSALDPVSITYNGNDSARASLTVLGHSVHVDVSPKLVGETLQFGVAGLNNLPPSVVEEAGKLVGKQIPLDQLPFGLTLQSLTASPDGVEVHLTGDNVTFRRS